MDPFVGELRLFGFNFAAVGWALWNGQILPISQNAALFSILGTTFGGNGTSNFALPNFQGLTPVGAGQGPGLSPYLSGQSGGAATVALTVAQLPVHTHPVQCEIASGVSGPANAIWGAAGR